MDTTTANLALWVFIVAFWFTIWAAIKISHLLAGRPLSDGPSLIPVVIVYPIVAFVLGAAINYFLTPWGTIAIIIHHLATAFWRIVTCPHPKPQDDG